MEYSIIVAGVSLAAFIAGLRTLRHALEQMSAGKLAQILQRSVKTPTRGMMTGLVSTALLQSSAAITAITVDMVGAGTIAFQDAIGVVLGANIGSTLIPQILTVNLWGVAIPALLLGVLGLLTGRRRLFFPSAALLGFATIFIALKTLSLGLAPLSHTSWFVQVLNGAGKNPLFGLLAGTLTSAMLQSSTATTVVTMALAEEGLVPLHGGIAIILGANIGSCVTSVVAAIGQSRSAQQVALSHVLLNAGGAILFLPFLAIFADFNQWLSDNPSQQIANAHTIYNVICSLLVWPATRSFGNLIRRLLPDKVDA